MAEAIGLAASLIAVIGVTTRIVGICKLCMESLEDCPKEFRMILVEISSTRALFDSLHFVQQHDPDSVDFLDKLLGPNGSITGCHAAIKELERLLPYVQSIYAQKITSREKAKIILKTLAWPLKQNKAKELLTRIAQHKTTINTAFSMEVWQDVQNIKHSVSQVQETLTESQRHDICGWIQQNDPSSLHNIARELIEEGTCGWVVGLPEWYQWANLHTRCLWIHGIPGCGKTVLAAHLIEETRLLCDRKVNSSYVSVYYYCHHSRNMDESTSLLRWVVSQLCLEAEKVPARLHNMHKRKRDPTRTEMLACLEEAIQWFDAVFIVIDALDESQAPRSSLLSLLQTLATDKRFQRVQLLATSREYVDIQEIMASIAQPISMTNPYLERDIGIAVQKMIESTPRFKAWPANTRDQVIKTLSRDAQGMFRWAVCQLDILRHAGSTDEVEQALSSLPPTLDETYHRIFNSVARQDWPLLRHVLEMIRFHGWLYGPWTSIGLSGTLILEAYSARRGGVDQFYSVETLREICGCLVDFDNLGFAALAHYTVREFIESDRVLTGPDGYFALRGPNKEVTEFIFRRALTVSFFEPLPTPNVIPNHSESIFDYSEDTYSIYKLSQSNLNSYCIFSASATLSDHEEFIATDNDLSKLAYLFLDPSSQNLNIRSNVMRTLVGHNNLMFRDSCAGQRFWDINWKQPPGESGVGVLVTLLWCSLLKLGSKLLGRIHTRLPSDAQFSLTIKLWRFALGLAHEGDFCGTITEFFGTYASELYQFHRAVDVERVNSILGHFGMGPISS